MIVIHDDRWQRASPEEVAKHSLLDRVLSDVEHGTLHTGRPVEGHPRLEADFPALGVEDVLPLEVLADAKLAHVPATFLCGQVADRRGDHTLISNRSCGRGRGVSPSVARSLAASAWSVCALDRTLALSQRV